MQIRALSPLRLKPLFQGDDSPQSKPATVPPSPALATPEVASAPAGGSAKQDTKPKQAPNPYNGLKRKLGLKRRTDLQNLSPEQLNMLFGPIPGYIEQKKRLAKYILSPLLFEKDYRRHNISPSSKILIFDSQDISIALLKALHKKLNANSVEPFEEISFPTLVFPPDPEVEPCWEFDQEYLGQLRGEMDARFVILSNWPPFLSDTQFAEVLDLLQSDLPNELIFVSVVDPNFMDADRQKQLQYHGFFEPKKPCTLMTKT